MGVEPTHRLVTGAPGLKPVAATGLRPPPNLVDLDPALELAGAVRPASATVADTNDGLRHRDRLAVDSRLVVAEGGGTDDAPPTVRAGVSEHVDAADAAQKTEHMLTHVREKSRMAEGAGLEPAPAFLPDSVSNRARQTDIRLPSWRKGPDSNRRRLAALSVSNRVPAAHRDVPSKSDHVSASHLTREGPR
jgi:hypothetical protein